MTIDLLPTLAGLIDAALPDHPIDGRDIRPLLLGEAGAKNPHEAYWLYYKQNELHAILAGEWKLMLPHQYRSLPKGIGGENGRPTPYVERPTNLALYQLRDDPAESRNLAASHPEKVAELLDMAETARRELGDQLSQRKGKGNRRPGQLTDAELADWERVLWPEGRKRRR